MRFLPALPVIVASLFAASSAAQDYDQNPSGRAVYGEADVRLTAGDGERSWIDGGFGKGRFGGEPDGDFKFRARAVEGDLVWQPRLSFALDATVAAIAQQGQRNAVDLSEAYVRYRHDPIGTIRLAARLGYFWPAISLEHSGPAWSVTETITPSAVNSWVGEEVKVGGGELTASVPFGAGRLAATGAVFGLDDTAGTLLAFRGWALHDVRAVAFGQLPLPPLNAFMQSAQATRTSSAIELDGQPGFYGKLGWSDATAKLSAFYYDNRGDPQAVDEYLQWGWRTRFAEVSAQLKPDGRTTLTAQALTGSTRMGYPDPTVIWVNTRFRSAFVLATRRVGAGSSVSLRGEAFGTRGRGNVLGAETNEDGWAATLAGRHPVGNHVMLLGEVLHVDSRRDDRTRVGLNPRQAQTIGQLAARVFL